MTLIKRLRTILLSKFSAPVGFFFILISLRETTTAPRRRRWISLLLKTFQESKGDTPYSLGNSCLPTKCRSRWRPPPPFHQLLIWNRRPSPANSRPPFWTLTARSFEASCHLTTHPFSTKCWSRLAISTSSKTFVVSLSPLRRYGTSFRETNTTFMSSKRGLCSRMRRRTRAEYVGERCSLKTCRIHQQP